MNISKKVTYSISFLIALLTIAACSSNSSTVPAMATIDGNVNFSRANLVSGIKLTQKIEANGLQHIFADVGNGQKTSASFSVNINLSDGGEFKTKAASATNANGSAAAVRANVLALKVWLFDLAATPNAGTILTGANVAAGGSTFSFNIANASGSAQVTYVNVPVNVTGRYYIGAAAYNSTTINPSTNITTYNQTNTNTMFFVPANNTNTFFTSLEAIALSNGGGGSPTGSVLVSAGSPITVDVTTGLTIALKLKDDTGATLQADVNFTDGSTFTAGFGKIGQGITF
jgi:hypothetical protein